MQKYPQAFSFALASLCANFFYYLFKVSPLANYMQNNIRQTFGKRYSAIQREEIALRHICLLFKAMVEFMRLPLDNPDSLEKKVKIQGEEHLKYAMDKGKGVILVSAHFGNWELMAAYLALRGYPLYAMYQRQKNKAINQWFNETRTGAGMRLVERWDNLRNVLKILRQGNALFIIADQHGEFENVFCRFFHHEVSVPAGPAAFARISGAAVLPIFMVRKKDDTHCLIIEPPLKLEWSENKQADLVTNSRRYYAVMEKYISQYPDHWLWLYNRWNKIKGVRP